MIPIKDSRTSSQPAVATYIIILLTSVIFIIEFFSQDIDSFFKTWSLIPAQVHLFESETWYPFLTSIFLHGGFMHLISNMWFLHIYGDNVEADLGRYVYIAVYVIGGIVANLVQFFFSMNSTVYHLGASGAIAGIMGYYLVRFPHNTITCLIPVRSLITIDLPAQAILGIWIITQFFNSWGSIINTSNSGGIAWWAHLGGAIFGIVLGYIVTIWKKKKI